MHKIIFKKISFSNFLSYGNTLTEIVFNDGLTWISGENGFGKSTILEAITFALFKVPYREINKIDLKNNTNKSKLFDELEFVRSDSLTNDTYVITRQMDNRGTISTVLKKNTVEQSHSALSQKLFEDEILGFNKRLWENVISLNAIQTVPFIDMELKDKRALIESVLTLNIDKWKFLNKEDYKNANVKFISATNDVAKYTHDLTEFQTIIDNMKRENSSDLDELNNEKKLLDDNKINLLNSVKVLKSEIIQLKNEIDCKMNELSAYSEISSILFNYRSVPDILILINENHKKYDIMKTDFIDIEKKYLSMKKKNEGVDKRKLDSDLSIINSEILNDERELAGFAKEVEVEKKSMNDIILIVKKVVPGVPCKLCGKLSTEEDVDKIKKNYRMEYKEKRDHVNLLATKINELKSNIENLNNEKKLLMDQCIEYDIDFLAFSSYKTNVYDLMMRDMKILKESIESDEHKLLKIKEPDIDIYDIDAVKVRISELEQKVKLSEKIKTDVTDLKMKYELSIEHKNNVELQLVSINNNISQIEVKIKKKTDLNLNDSYASVLKKYNDVLSDTERAKERIVKYSDEIEVTKYIDTLCSDGGIKKNVLTIFVPAFNRNISNNMRFFGLPFDVVFDDSMNYTFKSRYGLSKVYNGLSQGQKRLINFAIAMAFRDFVECIGDFHVNLLFLDEVLDVSTDPNTLRSMVSFLKKKLDLDSILLISHRGNEIKNYFDHKIEIDYDGRFSHLNFTKL